MKTIRIRAVLSLFLALVFCGTVLASTSVVHPVEYQSPIRDASWVQIPFENGTGALEWATDKGNVTTEGGKIIDGRTYVPFRWAVELFGGAATWSSLEDGTTDRVYLYAPGAEIPTTPTVERRPLSTIVYNWIPNLDEYLSTMEKDFESAYPEIDLTILNLPDYYGDPYGVLVNQADVYECDEGMLEAMKAADKLQPLVTSEVPNPDDFLQICKDVAVDASGTWWGIPHWTCTEFMFYNKNDTELAAVTNFSELEAAIGGADHPVGQGLLINTMGYYHTVGTYKECLMDLYKDDPATFWSYVDKDNINMQVVDYMKRMIALFDPGNGRNPLNAKMSPYLMTQFLYGNGRAYVYYSEGLGYMADIIDNAQNAWFDTTLNLDDIAVIPWVQADVPVSASTGYVDSFCLDKSLTGQKRADALTFAQWVTSTAENIRQVAPPDGSACRYLSPARMSVYTDPSLLAVAPLYKQFLPAMQRARYFLPPADLDETGLEDKLNELLPFN